MLRLLILFCGLSLPYLGWTQAPTHPPFICDGDFFLSLGTGGGGGTTGFYRVQTDSATGLLTFNGFSPGNSSGFSVNAMGYRVTDNYIYGVNPGSGSVYRIGADGIAVNVANPTYSTNHRYLAGDVTADGNYLVVLGDQGGNTSVVVTIDLFSGNYVTNTINLLPSGTSSLFTADMAIDPFTGTVYGYDGDNRRLITIDLATGALDNTTFPANQGVEIFGALYFDSFGELHGYGRPLGGGSQNSFYDIDINTGIPSFVTTGPSASSNDGCSCPFSLEMNHWVSPTLAQPCDTVVYYIEVANNSGGDKIGTELRTQLPQGLLIHQILDNPFPGTLSSGVGTNLLQITNATIPVGIDTLVMQVLVEPLPGPTALVLNSQARLYGLPTALGDSVYSDDPFTVPDPDPATLILTIDTLVLPTQNLTFCPDDSVLLDASTLPAQAYVWSNGATGPTLTVDQPGTYFVYALECSVLIDTFIVSQLPRPPVQVSADTTICQGDRVLFQATGATTYEWFRVGGGSQGTGPILNFDPGGPGSYYAVGTDLNGCRGYDTVSVQVQALPQVEAGFNQATCYYDPIQIGGLNDPNLAFNWSPGMLLDDSTLMQPQFVGSTPGWYQMYLTVSDSLGCQSVDSMRVQVLDFQLQAQTEDIDCFGNDNGSATVQVIGSAPYQYFWTDNAGLPLSNGSQSFLPLTIQNLEPGNYQVLVIDQNGCRDSVGFGIAQPASPLTSSILNSQNVDCFGNSNGGITVGGQGGTAPYEYSLNGGVSYQPSGAFSGLGGSNYVLTTRDANGCLSLAYDTITSPTGLFGNVSVKKNIDCFGANNGALTLAGAGGTGPYSLTLDGINYVNGLSLTNLAPGLDTVRLVDANGCEVPIPFEIFEPTPLVGDSVWARDLTCFEDSSGALAVNGRGGFGPYQYSLDGLTFQTDSLFQQVGAGIYQVVVQDDSLCQTTVMLTVNEPPLLTLNITNQQNVACLGEANGSLTVNGGGGTAPYLYQRDSLGYGLPNTFSGLTAGTYVLEVQDDSSCVSALTVTVTEPPLLTIAIEAQAHVDCFGEQTAWVRLQAQGGTLPYEYSQDSLSFQAGPQFNFLGAGNYAFWVRDANGCLSRINTEITEPPELILNKVDLDQIDCFGNDNGQVEATVSGGTLPYLYSLNGQNPQNSSIFANLSPGPYVLSVQDDSACMVSFPVEIVEPDTLVVVASHTDVTCYGFDDGTASSVVNGGTMAYTLEWDAVPPQTGTMANGLNGGTYTVLVTDANGCLASDTVSVFEPDTLTLEMVPGSIVEAYCDWANGQAAVTAAGGLGDLSVLWDGPNQLEGFSVDQLLGGNYQVSVSDANGCVTSIPVLIPDTPPAIPDFRSVPGYEDSILFSLAEQGIQFVNQSIGAVAYQWQLGDGGQSSATDPLHFYAETGTYPVTLTAYNSYFECPVDTTVWLSIIPDGDVYLPSAFSPNGDGHNDQFRVFGEGLVHYELRIYNRWGEQVAQLDQPAATWDGTNRQGRAVPEGVYVFTLHARFNDGARVERGGTVTLIR